MIALTVREQYVIAMAADGMTRDEIAEELGVGLEAVKKHLAHIYCKWSANNITHAVAIAVSEGICTPLVIAK